MKLYNYWLRSVNRRKLKDYLESQFLGENYAEIISEVGAAAYSSAFYHGSFHLNLDIGQDGKIKEIFVIDSNFGSN